MEEGEGDRQAGATGTPEAAPAAAEERKPILDRSRQDTLVRGLFMILFAIIYRVTEFVFAVLVIIQFLFTLILKERNPRLSDFSERLIAFMAQTWDFLAFHRERKPFPFSDWPAGRWDAGSEEEEPEVTGSATQETSYP
jgi:hypothetical protein